MIKVKFVDGLLTYPYSFEQLCMDNPQTSFPEPAPPELLAEYGVFPVVVLDPPAHDPATQFAELSAAPVKLGDAWTLDWTVRDKTQSELTFAKAPISASLVEA